MPHHVQAQVGHERPRTSSQPGDGRGVARTPPEHDVAFAREPDAATELPSPVPPRSALPPDGSARGLSEQIHRSPRVTQLRAYQDLADRSSSSARPAAPSGRSEGAHGLPTALRASLERLSGVGLGDVRVHLDSPEPARLHAHAFTRGPDIHLGPGQAHHLAHEGWHAVQQRRESVRPTLQLAARSGPGRELSTIAVNDDPRLEHEADVMGAAAMREAAAAGEASFAAPPPASPPPPSAPVIQAKMQAKNFRELVAEQLVLQQQVKQDPAKFKGQYTTTGFEHEFAVMTTGPLRGVSHLEIARSQETFAFTGLSFMLETDAQNALELVSPPYLIETIPGLPVPDPEEVDRVDTMTEDTLRNHVATQPTIGGLVAKFRDDPGLHFRFGNIKDEETEDVEIHRENMTPRTTETIQGQPISSRNNRLTVDGLRAIELLQAGDQSASKNASTHVNFATDAQTFDRMQQLHMSKGDVYEQLYLQIEDDFREVLYQKTFKAELDKHEDVKTKAIDTFIAAGTASTDLLSAVARELQKAALAKRKRPEAYAASSEQINNWKDEVVRRRVALEQALAATAKELASPRASQHTLMRARFLLAEAAVVAAEYDAKLSDDGSLLKQIDQEQYEKTRPAATDALDQFPLLGDGEKNMRIFLNALARTLSGQLSVVSQAAVVRAQEHRFADPGQPMPDALQPDQMLSSRVKDVHQVWIKDTIMNIGMGLLGPADWTRLKALIKGGVFVGGIKRKLAKYHLPPLMVPQGLSKDMRQIPLPAKQFTSLVSQALDQVVSTIDAHNLDGQGGSSAYKKRVKAAAKKGEKLGPPGSLGPSERPELFHHDPTHIGARQDTYIPSRGVQMPGIWGDRRLHVVESRKDTVERLRMIQALHKKSGSDLPLPSVDVASFDYAKYFKESLEKGSVLLGDGYVLTPAQAHSLAQHHLENVDVVPNGDCLFNSLIAVGAFAGNVRQFRDRIADAIHNGTVDVQPFMLDPVATERDIRRLGSYNNLAGDVTPSLICRVLEINLRIHAENGNVIPLDAEPPADGAHTYHVIRFTRPGAHYHATRPVQVVQQQPPPPPPEHPDS